jgi:archaellum component FlaF (FlaF/FlaG flagellin family)
MGFSVSGAVVVLMIGALIAFGGVYGAVSDSVDAINEANDDRVDRRLAEANVEVDLLCAYESGGGNTVVRASNNGTEPLSINRTDVLLDNEYVRDPGSSVRPKYRNRTLKGDYRDETVGADTTTWFPGEILVAVVDGRLSGYVAEPATLVAPTGESPESVTVRSGGCGG